MLKLSISENRPCRIHRCPTDTNDVVIILAGHECTSTLFKEPFLIWRVGWSQIKALADLGSMPGTCPPKGLDSFVSTYKIFETYLPRESTPPTRSTSPYEKSWIRHCKASHFFTKLDTKESHVRAMSETPSLSKMDRFLF